MGRKESVEPRLPERFTIPISEGLPEFSRKEPSLAAALPEEPLLTEPRPAESAWRASSTYDPGELDEQLRYIGWVLGAESGDPPAKQVARIDPPHLAAPRVEDTPKLAVLQPPVSEATSSWGLLLVLTWLSLAIGMMMVACGSVLTGWAILVDRPELWRLAAPIGLGGVVTLAVGLLLHTDHRRTARLEELSTVEANPDRDARARDEERGVLSAFDTEGDDPLGRLPRLRLTSFSDYPVA